MHLWGHILAENGSWHNRLKRSWMRFAYHTSGRPGMTLLEKIIYLADYIEPGRHFPGVDEVREMAKGTLDKALIKGGSKYDSYF